MDRQNIEDQHQYQLLPNLVIHPPLSQDEEYNKLKSNNRDDCNRSYFKQENRDMTLLKLNNN